jgi:RNA polymerase sigma-70 factor (ECF subfamily)
MPPLNTIEEPSDETLLARSLEGAPEDFTILVARYEKRLYGLLWRLCGKPDNLDDLYQQVWLRAWSGRISFQGRSKFGTWLFSIALNEVRAWRRKRKESVSIDQVPEPVQPGLSVLDRLLGKARKEAVNTAMARLSPPDQESLALRFQQELSYEEIAALTKTSPAQARLRNFRALRRLKDLLKDHEL